MKKEKTSAAAQELDDDILEAVAGGVFMDGDLCPKCGWPMSSYRNKRICYNCYYEPDKTDKNYELCPHCKRAYYNNDRGQCEFCGYKK